jgi:hypothetical protein
MKNSAGNVLGSARARACGFRRHAETNLAPVRRDYVARKEKVRDDDGVIASTRGACAPQIPLSRD